MAKQPVSPKDDQSNQQNAATDAPTLEEITAEVKAVRVERFTGDGKT